MIKSDLKKVTIYLTTEEYAAVEAIAREEEASVSAVLRAQLGLSYRRRGAPEGNRNRGRQCCTTRRAVND